MGNREWPWRANVSETAPREQPSWANFNETTRWTPLNGSGPPQVNGVLPGHVWRDRTPRSRWQAFKPDTAGTLYGLSRHRGDRGHGQPPDGEEDRPVRVAAAVRSWAP
jgi:hypothetical protein